MKARFKERVDRRIDVWRLGAVRRSAVESLRRRHPVLVGDYEHLNDAAISLLPSEREATSPVVRLLLPLSRPDALFAGMRTAIVFAGRLADQLGRTLEVRHYDWSRRNPGDDAAAFADIAALPHGRVRVRQAWSLGPQHEDDLTVTTFWDSAFAATVAGRGGYLDRSRVIYLVQDYEPEFYAASTESALSRATYHAGLRMVVNSRPLAAYLRDREKLAIEDDLVFRPHVDESRIAAAARGRRPSEKLRVTFYGRPGSSRNSYELGVASIRAASRAFARNRLDATFVSVGQQHDDIVLPEGRVPSLGKLTWSGYFEQLARTDVMLSFQQTPHPSHPPLDAVASGAFAVVNDMNGSRLGLSPRLLAVESDPDAVSSALIESGEKVRSGGLSSDLDQEFLERFGRPMEAVADELARSYV